MSYTIGKWYSWPSPRGKWYFSGMLVSIDQFGNGKMATDYDENWIVPLENLICLVN